ncbi:MAG: DUF4317 domain-containing protein [Oscillospiraceae bacterium]|nr:DUF4317 domain-containing protein [Oscillospiraceae bacterium]
MNKKELAEIRKIFNESSGFFTLDRVLTAYVDPEKNVLYKENKNYALIPEDEGTVMFETLRKVLGGSLGKHLAEYAFSKDKAEEKGTNGAYVPLSLTVKGKLQNAYANDELLEKIIRNYECSGAYAVIIGYCTYSITSRHDENDEDFGDREDEYRFIVTALCPACAGDDGLMFDRNNASIIKKSNTDLLISKTPTDGFLYPVFSDRQPDPNSVLVYTKTPKKPNISMVEDVLDCDFVMTCQNEKAAFGKILSEVLGDDLSYTVITQVNERLSEIVAGHKNDTALPKINENTLCGILLGIGFDDKSLEALPAAFEDNVPNGEGLNAVNLAENKVVIKTSEATVSVAGIAADKVRTSVQNGRKCLVIDLDDPNVTVNDIDVRL